MKFLSFFFSNISILVNLDASDVVLTLALCEISDPLRYPLTYILTKKLHKVRLFSTQLTAARVLTEERNTPPHAMRECVSLRIWRPLLWVPKPAFVYSHFCK